MSEVNESIAHITLADGTKWQVLNEVGDDWDEEATKVLVDAHLAGGGG